MRAPLHRHSIAQSTPRQFDAKYGLYTDIAIRQQQRRHRQRAPRALDLASLSPRVKEVLDTPGLEAPEGSSPVRMLEVTEAFWKGMKAEGRSRKTAPKVVVSALQDSVATNLEQPEFDVCIAGGTLGIFVALALQLRGHKVCVIEKRRLQGREQEWNISRGELDNLLLQGLVTREELENCIVTSWKFDRIGFKGGEDIWVEDVLNVGISPRALIETMKARFLENGGALFEETSFKAATVMSNGVTISLTPVRSSSTQLTATDVNRPSAVVASSNGIVMDRRQLTTRLLIDCMGHYSPIVKQIRNSQTSDGMVMVVGGCFESSKIKSGQLKNDTADLLYTFTDSFQDSQLFWEAFPAEGGTARTAYMFLYSDNRPERPSFSALLDRYLSLLPQYQGVDLKDVKFKRLLMGGFPCYMDKSPLPPAFDRVIQIGDAAAAQSPLSFGGFAAMVRHIPRLAGALDDSLKQDRLTVKDLWWLQPYQPSLSVSWLFQRSMSVKVGQLRENNRGWLPAGHINRLMRCNFGVLKLLGPRVLCPFVADSMQLGPLAATMALMVLRDPIVVTTVLFQVGPKLMLRWASHFIALAFYSLGFTVLRLLVHTGLGRMYRFQRMLEAFKYGSGLDNETSYAQKTFYTTKHSDGMHKTGHSMPRAEGQFAQAFG
jgi:lycopene cyclase CruP